VVFPDQLCITVTDQGVGFEPARLDDRSKAGQVGWGLFRIRERLTLLGGRLDIDSAPGKGTQVRLVAPRDAAADTVAGASELRPALTGRARRSVIARPRTRSEFSSSTITPR
jgi:signal transduction histidine kinase